MPRGNNEDVVWENTVDGGVWECRVVGTEESMHHGVLTVTRRADNRVILTQEVTITYGAMFGPDISDVMEWQDICIEAIDNYQAEH